MGISWARVGAGLFAGGAQALVKNKEAFEKKQKELADQSFAANQKFFDAKVSFAAEKRKQRQAERKNVQTAVDTVSQTLQAKYGLTSNESINYAAQLLGNAPTIEAAKIKSSQLIKAADQAGNDPMQKAKIIHSLGVKDVDPNLTLLEAANVLTERQLGEPYKLEAPTPKITTRSFWGSKAIPDKRADIQKKQFEDIAGLYNEGIKRNVRDVSIPKATGRMPQTFVERSVEESYNFAVSALNAAKQADMVDPDLVKLRTAELRIAEEAVARLAALKRKPDDSGGLTVENIISLSKTAKSLEAREYFDNDPSRITYGNFKEREKEAKYAQGEEQNFRNYASVKAMPKGAAKTKAFNEFFTVASPLGINATPETGESARNAIARKYEQIYNVRLGASTLSSWEEMFRAASSVYQKDKTAITDPRMKEHLENIYESKKPDGTPDVQGIDNYLGSILQNAFFIPVDTMAIQNFKQNLGIQ